MNCAKVISVFLFLCVILTSPSFASDSAYEIIDSQFGSDVDTPRSTVYWIDNGRVLFIGHDSKRVREVAGARIPQRVLYIWNLSNTRINPHADVDENTWLCYRRGYIHYRYALGDELVIREGQLGKEIERRVRLSDVPTDEFENPITCKTNRRQKAVKWLGKNWFMPLLPGHGGFGGFQQVKEGHSAVLYLPDGRRQPIELDVPKGPTHQLSYSDHLDGYVIRSFATKKSENTGDMVWILFPGGALQKFDIPGGLWMRGSTGYIPVKKGWVLWSHASAAGAAGLYVVNGNTATQIASGYIGSTAASPDGCRLAFVHRDPRSKETKAALKVVNLCTRTPPPSSSTQ